MTFNYVKIIFLKKLRLFDKMIVDTSIDYFLYCTFDMMAEVYSAAVVVTMTDFGRLFVYCTQIEIVRAL